MNFFTWTGEKFEPFVVKRRGLRCRFCGCVLAIGSKAAFFRHQPPQHQFECSPCVYAGFDGVTPPWKE